VRNTAYSWLKANRPAALAAPDDEQLAAVPSLDDDPEAALIRSGDRKRLGGLIEALPAEFRECLILREIEDLPYKEIAAITGVPIGTVMSRLARARRLMQRAWHEEAA